MTQTFRVPLILILLVQGVCGFFYPLTLLASSTFDPPTQALDSIKQVYTNTSLRCNWCTQVYFTPNADIVISSNSNSIFYRKNNGTQFHLAPFTLNRPHSILFNQRDDLYYLTDTDNNRILAFTSLEDKHPRREITSIDNISLHRPHDIVQDPVSGWMYSINPHVPEILRFDHTGQNEKSLDLSRVLGYSRSLSIVQGKIYVVGSSSGKIVEISDFDHSKYTVYVSPGKKTAAHSGNWHDDGLIPNAIAYYQGYWYITSFFISSASCSNHDCNQNKFIRFKSWKEFEAGKWQDLSHLLPDSLTPYYLTNHQNSLYIAIFNFEFPGTDGAIYKLFSPRP